MKNRAHRRTYGHDEIDAEGSWAISYGDMVTLLLCFFILFFSVDPKAEHQKKLQSAVFSLLENPTLPPATSQPGTAPAGNLTKGATTTLNMGQEAKDGLDQELLKKWPGVPHKVGQKILIEFPAVSFFRSGHVELTRDGQKALKKFVSLYMPYAGQNRLVVRAFTDTRAVKAGRSAYRDNLELSALRSVAAMRSLSEAGIPLHKMRVGGYGEFQLSKIQLDSIPEDRRPSAAMELARKVILLIEPEEADL